MRLSLRFIIPLVLALAAIAYAVVPLVNRLTPSAVNAGKAGVRKVPEEDGRAMTGMRLPENDVVLIPLE